MPEDKFDKLYNDIVTNELDVNSSPIDDDNTINDGDEFDKLYEEQKGSGIEFGLPTTGETVEEFDFTPLYGMDNAQRRAEEQSGWKQLGNMVNQAVVGEIVGGTIEGIGYLLDIDQYGDLASGSEKEFGNWFSDIGKGIKEFTREATPIYETSPGEFAPNKWSWWMANASSVASTLSLMIPAAGVVRGVSALAKMTNLGSKLGKVGKWASTPVGSWISKGVGQAVVSRHMENLMESSSVYDEVYNSMIQNGKTEDEAKQSASLAASNAYSKQWAMLAQDIPQYLLLNRAFGKASVANSTKISRRLGKSSLPVVGKKSAAIGWSMSGEAFEEGYQYIVNEEAKHLAEVQAGLATDDKLRLGEYLKEGDLWTASFFGALGAGFMQTAGKGINRRIIDTRNVGDAEKSRIEDINSWGPQVKFWSNMRRVADNTGKDGLSEAANIGLAATMGVNAAENGNVDNVVEMLESMKNPTDEDLEMFEIERDEITEDFQKSIPNVINNIRRIEKLYNDNSKKHNGRFVGLITKSQFELEGLSKQEKSTQSKIRTLESEQVNLDKLSVSGRELFDLNGELKANQKVVKTLKEQLSKDDVLSKESKSNLKDIISERQSVIDDIKKEIFDVSKERTPEDTKNDKKVNVDSAKLDDLKEEQTNLEYLKVTIERMQNSLDDYTNKEWQDEKIADSKKKQDKVVKEAEEKVRQDNEVAETESTKVNTKKSDALMESIRKRYTGDTPANFEKEKNDLANYLESKNIPSDAIRSVLTHDNLIEVLSTNFDQKSLRSEINAFYDNLNKKIDDKIESKIIDDGEFVVESYEEGDKDYTEQEEQGEFETETKDGNEYLTSAHQFLMERDGLKWKTKYENGNPVISPKNDIGIPWADVNNSDLIKPGDTITYKYQEDRTNQLITDDKITEAERTSFGSIFMYHTKDGERTLIGELKSSVNETSSLYKLRKSIIEDGNTLDTKVVEKYSGRIWTTSTLNKPHEVLNADVPLIYGVGRIAGTRAFIEVPNAPEGYQRPFNKATPGAVYLMVPAANGTPIPVRLFTKKLSELPELKQEAINIFNETNKGNLAKNRKAIRKIVWVDFYIDNDGIIVEVSEKDGKKSYNKIDDVSSWLDNKVAQIDVDSINEQSKTNLNYNQDVSEEGRLSTDINQGGPYTHSAKVLVEEYSPEKIDVSKKDEESKEVKSDTVDRRYTVIEDDNDLFTVTDTDTLEDIEPPAPSEGSTGINLDLGSKERVAESEPYTKWNSEEELNWFKQRFPGVPISSESINRLREIVGDDRFDSWGAFKDSAVYIWDNAGKGTVYHEAFHVIFNLYNTKANRDTLISEAKKKYGKPTDLRISELKTKNPNLSDKLIDNLYYEELMAEDFVNYIQTEDITDELTKWQKIAKFFTDIYKWIKSVATNDITIDEIYYKGSKGVYRVRKIFGQNNSFVTDNITRERVPGYSPSEQRNRINSINSVFFDVIDNIRENTPSLNTSTDIEIINKAGIPFIYNEVYASIYKYYKETPKLTDVEKEGFRKLLNNFIVEEEGEPDRENLYHLAIRDLANYGIKVSFGINETHDLTDLENKFEYKLNEDVDKREKWQISYTGTSRKETLSFELRKALRLLKLDGVDDLGFPRRATYHNFLNYLERSLADIYTTEGIMSKLDELSEYRPEVTALINKLNEDDSLKSKFISRLTNTHAVYLSVVERNDRFDIITSNRRGVVNLLIDDWKENLNNYDRNQVTNKDGTINKNLATSVKLELDKFSEALKSKTTLSNEDGIVLSSISSKMGIEIKPDVFQKESISKLKDLVYGSQSLSLVADRLAEGINPYTGTEIETTTLTKLAKVVKKNDLDERQSSYRSTDNKTRYSHLLPNFITKMVQSFKNDEIINHYQSTPFFADNIWLSRLRVDSVKKNFNYTLLDSLKLKGQFRGTTYENMFATQLDITAMNMYHNSGNNKYANYRYPVLSDAPVQIYLKFEKYDNEEIVNNLYQVAVQEYKRINRVREEIKTLDKSQLVENYHVAKKEGETPRGLVYNFLPFLNKFKGDVITNEVETKGEITKWLDESVTNEIDRLTELKIIGQKKNPLDNRIKDVDSFIKDYVYNSAFANTQMIQMFSGDLAFYPDVTNFQKRNKQVYSPKLSMDLLGKYTQVDGTELTVRPQYNTTYVLDSENKTRHYTELKATLEQTELTKKKQNDILNSTINETDAQTYITLDRYREVMIGYGRWDKYEKAYPDLKAGRATSEQLELVLQPIKPFYFGHSKLPFSNTIAPVQNKNAEVLLLPQLANKSSRLKRILERMEAREEFEGMKRIDSLSFTSVVKVGMYGATNLSNLDNLKSLNIVKLNNENFGLQVEIPEHFIDTTSKFATQIRKIVWSDIDLESKYKLPNSTTIGGEEMMKLFQDILHTDLNESYNKVAKRFESIEGIRQLLLQEIINRNMSPGYEEAIDLVTDKDGNKKFKLPLYHFSVSKKNEELLNSVFKNNVTIQMINGGAYVQTSGYGFSDDLKLQLDEVTGSIKSMDVMLPWWSKKFFPKEANGDIDITKIPENVREMIGYRIPTEGKYSTAPLRVVGFLPEESGGIVLLPADITRIADSDFDADEMFTMTPWFELSEDKQNIRKIEYDYTKAVSSQSRKARDNAKIDIIRAILTSDESFADFIEGGGSGTLSMLRDKVGKSEELNPILPSTYTDLSVRNQTGKALRGISVNANNFHSIVQHSELAFKTNIVFDSQYRRDLGVTTNTRKLVDYLNQEVGNNNISKDLQELLAMSVDNAKDPKSDILNLNTFTTNVGIALTMVGFPLETTIGFISQPILKEFTKRYYREGANREAEENILKDLTIELKEKGAIPKTATDTLNLNTNELYDWINDEKKTTKPVNYYTNQLKVLDAFKVYTVHGRDLSEAIRATLADTTGAGPTISNNEAFLNTVKRVRENSRLENTETLFSETAKFKSVYDFTEYGIRKPNDLLKKRFPWAHKGFRGVRDKIAENLKNRNLSPEDIEYINYHLYTYLLSGYTFFDSSGRNDIVNNFPKRFQKYKDSNKNEDIQPLLNSLHVRTKDDKVSIDRIEFVNTGSLTQDQEGDYSRMFEIMLNGSGIDITTAEDLVLYTYFTAGTTITSNSFGKLVPTDFWYNLVEGDDRLSNYIDKLFIETDGGEDIYDSFINSFYRNNANRVSFVPRIDDENKMISSEIKMYKNTPTSFLVNGRGKALADKSLVLEVDNISVRYVPFVTKEIDGKVYLFELVGTRNDDTAVYNIVEKLGYPTYIIEYDRNNPLLESVVKDNKLLTIPTDKYYNVNEYEQIIEEPEPKEDKFYQLSSSKLKKELGIHKMNDLSDQQVINIKTNVRNFNIKNNTAHFVNFTDYIGESGLRNITGIIERWNTEISRNITPAQAVKQLELWSLYNEKGAEADIELNNKLKSILGQYGVTIEMYDDLKLRTGVDASGMADIFNRTILVSKGKEDISTIPEEAAHFFIELLGDDNLIVQRMLKLAPKSDIYNEVKEQYTEQYDGDETKILKEVAGKLLGTYIIKKSRPVDELDKSILATLRRLWERVKQIFKRADERSIQEAVESVYGETAESILQDQLIGLDEENLKKSTVDVLAQLDDAPELSTMKKLLEKSIESIVKKISVLEAKGKKDLTIKDKELLHDLRKKFSDDHASLGLETFLTNVKKQIFDIKDEFADFRKSFEDISNINLKEASRKLKEVKIFTKAFEPIIDDIIDEIEDQSLVGKLTPQDRMLLRSARYIKNGIDVIDTQYNKLGIKLFAQYLKPFLGNRGIVPFGKHKGEKIDLEKMLKVVEGDITFTQRWLDAMDESSDEVLKLIAVAIKDVKLASQREAYDIQRDLIAGLMKLEESGVKNTEFIYEILENGKLSGNIVSEYNQGDFEKNMSIMFQKLIKKHGVPADKDARDGFLSSNPTIERDYNKDWAKWFKVNMKPHPKAQEIIDSKSDELSIEAYNEWIKENTDTDYNGEIYYKYELSVPADKYKNSEYKKIQDNPAMKEFYDLIWDVKQRMDSYLPEIYRNKYRLPQLRKDTIERIKRAGSLREVAKLSKEAAYDALKRREDELERGGVYALTNIEGKPESFLPILFTNKLDEMGDLSTDIVSTMSSFVAMSVDYKNMNNVIDILELGKDVVNAREIIPTKRGIPIVEKINIIGQEVNKKLRKDSSASNAVARLDDYYNMVVYGKFKKEGRSLFFGKVDSEKLLDFFGRYTAINNLALNVYAGIQNPILGNSLIRQEAFAGEFIDHKDLLYADKTYWGNLPKTIGDIGQRNQTSKLQLWMDSMGVLQDFHETTAGLTTERKTLFGNMFKSSQLFFINHMGEHYMQGRMSLALANRVKLKDKSGKEITLWDAYEVVGNKLLIKDGITKENGKSWTEKDLRVFIRKQNFANKRLHGIYNQIDRSAAQQYATGRLALMFRKFMKPGWNRRFENLQYNYEGQVWTEGYYKTTGRFLKGLVGDIREGQFSLIKNWDNLHDVEKYNLIRSMTEAAYVLTAALLGAILAGISDDDDENWALNMTAYQANRLYTELRFFSSFKEFFRIVQSPMAAINQVDNILNLVNLSAVPNWFERLESGKYKGYTRLHRSSVKVIPMYKTLSDLMTPEEKLKFFTQPVY